MEKYLNKIDPSVSDFAENFISLSKENHKIALFVIYKHFGGKKIKKNNNRLKFLIFLLVSDKTNVIVKEHVKKIILYKWNNFTKGMKDLHKVCVKLDTLLLGEKLSFIGNSNKDKITKFEADKWWERNFAEEILQ